MDYEKQYRTLKAGDVRMLGDEVRSIDIGKYSIYCKGKMRTLDDKYAREGERIPTPSPWQNVSLLGKPILPSDLMHAEFRRRII